MYCKSKSSKSTCYVPAPACLSLTSGYTDILTCSANFVVNLQFLTSNRTIPGQTEGGNNCGFKYEKDLSVRSYEESEFNRCIGFSNDVERIQVFQKYYFVNYIRCQN